MEELKPRIHNEKNGLDYVLVGDVYLPDLKLPSENRPIGRYGVMRRDFLKKHRHVEYTVLLMKGTFWTYLADINEQALDLEERLMEQMAKQEGVTEALKASDQMEWVRRMNSIQNRVEEMILHDLIYV